MSMTNVRVTRRVARLLRVLLEAHDQRKPGTTGAVYSLTLKQRAKLGGGPALRHLKILESSGWVDSEWVGGGYPRRRYYRLTEKGVPLAREAVAEDDRRVPWWKIIRRFFKEMDHDDE